MPITNNEIKFIRSLSSKRAREEAGLFVCEGEKLVAEAVASGYEVSAVYRREDIGDKAMERITQLSSPSPVLALVRIPSSARGLDVKEAFGIAGGLVLGLDSVRDPGNLGTIIRLADWFGIRTVFASRDTVDIYNPKVVQATMGAVFRVRTVYCDLAALAAMFSREGMPVLGTFLDGDDIYSCPLPCSGTRMLVMGSESNGISPQVGAHVSRRLLIPSCSPDGKGSESLNVAIATAISCAELRRREKYGM